MNSEMEPRNIQARQKLFYNTFAKESMNNENNKQVRMKETILLRALKKGANACNHESGKALTKVEDQIHQ